MRFMSTRMTLILNVFYELFGFISLLFQSRAALVAENIFLRKQLALYEERKVKPHRACNLTRYIMVMLANLFDWKNALVIVQPDTFIKWHRNKGI